MNETNSSFLKNRTIIIIIIVIIFVVASVFLWLLPLKTGSPGNENSSGAALTEEQIQAIIKSTSGTSEGEVLTKTEKAKIRASTSGKGSSSTSTLPPDQKANIINSTSAK